MHEKTLDKRFGDACAEGDIKKAKEILKSAAAKPGGPKYLSELFQEACAAGNLTKAKLLLGSPGTDPTADDEVKRCQFR